MLLLLALIGCNPTPENPQLPEVNGPETLEAVQVMPRIETHLAAVMPPPAKVRTVVDLPEGAAILGDCGAPVHRRPRPRPSRTPIPTRGARPNQGPGSPPTDATSATIPMHTPPTVVTVVTGAPMSEAGDATLGYGGEGRAVVGGSTSGLGMIGAGDGSAASSKTAQPNQPGSASRRSKEAAKKGRAKNEQAPKADKSGGDAAFDPAPQAEPEAVARSLPDDAKPRVQAQLEALGYAETKTAKNRETAERNIALDESRVSDLSDMEADEDEMERSKPMEEEATNQWLDWGATVHLSNDDSMSLASAQRLLWTTGRGRRPQMSEIRPHELLNYFSFDTVPVPDGQTFSVLGAADIQGETITVALAVQGAIPERQPLDLTVVIDRSGSMAAEGRMDYTKRGLNQMFGQLRDGDRLDLVYFESRTCTALQDYVVGRDDPALLQQAMASLRPMGSTDLNGGLQQAYRLQAARDGAASHGRNRRVMLITDAQMNTGTIDEGIVTQIGQQLEDHNIRLTGVGVGRDFRDDVLDRLTEKGKGAYVYLGSEAVVDRVFGAGFDSLVRTLAHDVRFSLDLPPSLAMTRFYGEEASTNAADIQPINYFAGTSQVFLQDLTARDGKLVLDDPLVMRIEWRDAATGEPDALELRTTVGALLDGDRRNVHKAKALMAWTDWAQSWAMAGKYTACSTAMDTYADRTALLSDDAEVQYLSGLTQQVCGRAVVAQPKVAVKVRVDSDIPIARVALLCGGRSWSESMGGGDTVARFADARSGMCQVTLQGTVAMRAQVEVPSNGGDVRCTVRGGRMSCS